MVPKAVPRSQRRKEAKAAKKQRRIEYYSNKHRRFATPHEDDVTSSHHTAPLDTTPSIKSSLKTKRKELDGRAKENRRKRKLSDVPEKTTKKLRWCPTVVPNVREGLESGASDTSSIDSREAAPALKRIVANVPILGQQENGKGPSAEDEEMCYLERKLGLRGSNGKKREIQLLKELNMLDGLDGDLLEFTDLCLEDGHTNVAMKVQETENGNTSEEASNSDESERNCESHSVVESRGENDDDDDDLRTESNDMLEHSLNNYDDSYKDEEIKYLETQLRLRGNQQSKRKEKLLSELNMLDGLDENLLPLVEDCLKPGSKKKKKIRSVDETMDSDKNEEESTNGESDGESLEEIGEDEINNDNSMDDEVKVENIKDNKENGRLKKNRDLKTPGKYIPPALRMKVESATLKVVLNNEWNSNVSEIEQKAIDIAVSKVELKMIGLLNRVSEGNLSRIVSQIGEEIFCHGHALALKYFNKLISKNQKKSKDTVMTIPIGASASLLTKLSSLLSRKIVSVSVECLCSTISLISCQIACTAALSARTSYRVSLVLLMSYCFWFFSCFTSSFPLSDLPASHY